MLISQHLGGAASNLVKLLGYATPQRTPNGRYGFHDAISGGELT
jgi:hypothetical protein